MKRFIASAAVIGGLIGGALSVTACGALNSNELGGGQVSYEPYAYGANGQCYYVQSPAEAIALEAAGLCPSGWVPAPMPAYWLNEYYLYYSSQAYYTHYVPVRIRTHYVTTERAYGTSHRAVIASAASKARYTGSDGSTATGTVVARKAKVGSGSAGTTFGSGKRGTSGYTSGTSTSNGSTLGGGKRGTTPGTSGYKPAKPVRPAAPVKLPPAKPVKVTYGGGKR